MTAPPGPPPAGPPSLEAVAAYIRIQVRTIMGTSWSAGMRPDNAGRIAATEIGVMLAEIGGTQLAHEVIGAVSDLLLDVGRETAKRKEGQEP